MRGLDEWEVSKPETFPAPKPVLYSRVACPSCGGVTVEVAPKTRRLGRDDRRHVGTPYVVVTRHQFWCDGCEVMTWRKYR
jgi:predicted RNA-binding Zn-ribbon protein involved in translation (DUF1610 family)